MIRLYEEFKSQLFSTFRTVKISVLLPLYCLNVIVNIVSNNLELYLLKHLATPQISERYGENLLAAGARLSKDLENLCLKDEQENLEKVQNHKE